MRKKETSSSSSQMTKTQIDFCRRTTQSIYDLPIAKIFRVPVNLKEVPNYKEKVKKPMDLGTVLSRIEAEHYKNVEQWKNDMKLIWENAKEFNPPGSFYNLIACELKMSFEKQVIYIPKNDLESWQFKVKKQHQKIARLLEVRPKSTKKSKFILKPPSDF